MTDVYFVLLPGVVLLDVAGAAEAFRIAEQERPGSFALHFVSPSRQLRTGIGLELARLKPLPKQLPQGSLVVVTGIVGGRVRFDTPDMQRVVQWLPQVLADESSRLMCVCAGSVIAAKAGVLRGRECTTHHDHLEELAALDSTAIVHANRIFVEDGRVLTSAGVTAGIDLTLHVIGEYLGHQVAATVARQLVVYMRRSGSDPQLSPWVMYRNHIHPAVHRVQDAVLKNPSFDWTSARLAALAHTSERNLTRLFTEHAGCSPLAYVQRIRVALARELLTNSSLAIERVAEQAGFSSAHHLRRVWKRWESLPPASIRREHGVDRKIASSASQMRP
jgi:transcriptional regulator GlxA family with amidase domain